MKTKSVFTVTDKNATAWALECREDLCCSIINHALTDKHPKIYHHFFVIDRLNNDEVSLLADAFSTNKKFNIWRDNTFKIRYHGEILCDDNDNILNPSYLDEPSDIQIHYWEQSLPWPSDDDDDEPTLEETEGYDPCQNNDAVESAD